MKSIRVGLKDKFGTDITDGCLLEAQTTIAHRYQKGTLFRCVFNIPQHRFGFEMVSDKDEKIVNPSLDSSLPFYATPLNVAKLKVI